MIVGTTIPNNAFVSWLFVESLLAIARQYPIKTIEGTSVADNRNRLCEYAMKKGEDLLIVDSDMVFFPDQVMKIEEYLDKGLGLITGVCSMGRPPYEAAIFKREKTDYIAVKPQEGLNKVDACGTAFFGISKEVLEKMPDEPFTQIVEDGLLHGNDISFCHRARQEKIPIWCDSELKIGHLRARIY